MEAVLMILPPVPCAIICLAASWVQMRTPRPLTRMIWSQLSSVVSRKRWGLLMPALLKITSSLPYSDAVRATSACTCSRVTTSTRAEMAAPPCARASAAESSACSPLRSAKTTLAPSATRRKPIALPIPRAAPVTIHTFPCSLTCPTSLESCQDIRLLILTLCRCACHQSVYRHWLCQQDREI